KWHPGYYILTVDSQDATESNATSIASGVYTDLGVQWQGIQHRIYWKKLEPTQGNYFWDDLDALIGTLAASQKRLFLQLIDRVFNTTTFTNQLPAYLNTMGCVWTGTSTSGSPRTLVRLWD